MAEETEDGGAVEAVDVEALFARVLTLRKQEEILSAMADKAAAGDRRRLATPTAGICSARSASISSLSPKRGTSPIRPLGTPTRWRKAA